MLNCREATRLVSEGMERRLTLVEGMRLRLHLMICRGCSNFRRHMASLRQLARAYTKGTRGEPDPD
jgi:hypothetical protein